MSETAQMKKEKRERKWYILILLLVLAVFWLVFDVFMEKEEVFKKDEEYSFTNRTDLEIKEKIKQEIKRYQSTDDPRTQICALVHMLECNYYLLYNRFRGTSRYYDFIKIVLFPSLRNSLRRKESYIRQAKRYLKRKRNLNFTLTGYEFTVPRFSGQGDETVADVRVRRMLTGESGQDAELFKYRFRKHTDKRYYLDF
jgi:hypothetical protein